MSNDAQFGEQNYNMVSSCCKNTDGHSSSGCCGKHKNGEGCGCGHNHGQGDKSAHQGCKHENC
ncbi:MAG: hypothetical protein ACRC68_06105 [Clostridium sp.]